MKVNKITLWNGEVFYTDEWSTESMQKFVDRVAKEFGRQQGDKVTFELVEMTPEEYQAIPATHYAARLLT